MPQLIRSSLSRSIIYSLTAIALSSSLTGCLDQLNDPNNAAAIERASQVLGNTLPIARAGSDQSVVTGTTVMLDGNTSSDKEGALMSYTWRQLSGTPITLKSPYTSQTSFIAPTVQSDEALQFELLVTDSQGWPSSDYITITVKSTPQAATLLKGKFIASPNGVAGLTYETPTQSGLTSATGEFNYQEGETVTFKVGDIVLGKTTAKAQLSPFDLVGITQPPVTSAETSKTLRLMENSTAPIPFEVATNIATFLQTLDEDNIPENGITLSNNVTALAKNRPLFFNLNKSKDFENYSAFNYMLSQGREKLLLTPYTAIKNYTKVLDQLYLGLGLKPTIAKVSLDEHPSVNGFSIKETYDFNPQANLLNKKALMPENTVFTRDWSYYYNFTGMVFRESRLSNFGLDDWRLDQVFTNSYYNDSGKLESHIFSLEPNALEFGDLYIYDTYGMLLDFTSYEISPNTNSKLSSTKKFSYLYNSLSLPITKNTLWSNGDGSYRTVSTSNFGYNNLGKLTRILTSYFNNDTSLSKVEEINIDWINQIKTSSTKVYDYTSGKVQIITEKTSNFNEFQQVIEETIKSDINADSKWDSIITWQTSYDELGNQLNLFRQEDSNADGMVDKVYKETIVKQDNGFIRKAEEDIGGKGIYELVKNEVVILDQNNNWISKVATIKGQAEPDLYKREYKNYSQWFPLYEVKAEHY